MKRKTAYNIAIESIQKAQRQYYPGHFEYLQGGSPSFEFAKKDHKKWQKLQDAIKILERERDQGSLFNPMI